MKNSVDQISPKEYKLNLDTVLLCQAMVCYNTAKMTWTGKGLSVQKWLNTSIIKGVLPLP